MAASAIAASSYRQLLGSNPNPDPDPDPNHRGVELQATARLRGRLCCFFDVRPRQQAARRAEWRGGRDPLLAPRAAGLPTAPYLAPAPHMATTPTLLQLLTALPLPPHTLLRHPLLLQAWTMPLQGVANAAVFSRWLRANWKLRASAASLIARSCSRGRARRRLPPECAAGVARTNLEGLATSPAAAVPPAAAAGVAGAKAAAAGVAQAATATPATGRKGIGTDPWPTAQLFAATWNVGEASPPSAAELAAWMPAGRDAYFIGLQECLAPAAWQRALADALALHGSGGGGGGGEAYELLTERKIGSTQTKLGYHGYIVLLAFARRRLRETGALSAATLHATQGYSLDACIGLQPAAHADTVCSTCGLTPVTRAVSPCNTCGYSLQHVRSQARSRLSPRAAPRCAAARKWAWRTLPTRARSARRFACTSTPSRWCRLTWQPTRRGACTSSAACEMCARCCNQITRCSCACGVQKHLHMWPEPAAHTVAGAARPRAGV